LIGLGMRFGLSRLLEGFLAESNGSWGELFTCLMCSTRSWATFLFIAILTRFLAGVTGSSPSSVAPPDATRLPRFTFAAAFGGFSSLAVIGVILRAGMKYSSSPSCSGSDHSSFVSNGLLSGFGAFGFTLPCCFFLPLAVGVVASLSAVASIAVGTGAGLSFFALLLATSAGTSGCTIGTSCGTASVSASDGALFFFFFSRSFNSFIFSSLFRSSSSSLACFRAIAGFIFVGLTRRFFLVFSVAGVATFSDCSSCAPSCSSAVSPFSPEACSPSSSSSSSPSAAAVAFAFAFAFASCFSRSSFVACRRSFRSSFKLFRFSPTRSERYFSSSITCSSRSTW
uniref:Uncharacterized protein n=1 Tax=Anopheles coluzzii TaxID=1518534 RepID=A0A8W7PRI2_ANOCL